MTQEFKDHKKKKDKAIYQLKMMQQYFGYIRKKFNQDSIFEHLEEKGVDHEVRWSLHKLLLHNVDDAESIKFLEGCVENVTHQLLDKEWEERRRNDMNKL